MVVRDVTAIVSQAIRRGHTDTASVIRRVRAINTFNIWVSTELFAFSLKTLIVVAKDSPQFFFGA
jgi:hypothetical protein